MTLDARVYPPAAGQGLFPNRFGRSRKRPPQGHGNREGHRDPLQNITPGYVWLDATAEESAAYQGTIFTDSGITVTARYDTEGAKLPGTPE